MTGKRVAPHRDRATPVFASPGLVITRSIVESHRRELLTRSREYTNSDKLGPIASFGHVVYRRVVVDQRTFLWFTQIIEESPHVSARLPTTVSNAFAPYVGTWPIVTAT